MLNKSLVWRIIAILISIISFSVSIAICVITYQVLNGELIELLTVQQMSNDWNVTPFTKIRVSNDKCDSNEEPVFGSLWQGTVLGCD